MGGRVPVKSWYWSEKQADGALVMEWTPEKMEVIEGALKDGTEVGSYGEVSTAIIRDFLGAHADAIRGRHCAVLGSQVPWLETLLLMNGAAHVTTIEYASIHSTDSRITALTPAEWKETYWRSTSSRATFDCVASFSSIEHAGLGRYGDELNPYGDLQVMAKLGCSAKPGATFLVGVPYGFDTVFWNAHRSYGPLRAPQLFANLKVQDRVDIQFEPYSCDFCSQAKACAIKRTKVGKYNIPFLFVYIMKVVRASFCYATSQTDEAGKQIVRDTQHGLDQAMFFAEKI